MTVSCLLSSSLFVQLKKKTLEVTVWDYDRSSSSDFLGEVSAFRMFELSNPHVFALFCPLLSSLVILSFGKASKSFGLQLILLPLCGWFVGISV